MSNDDVQVFEPFDERMIPAAVEAVLFAAGDPLPAERLADILGMDPAKISILMEDLINDYSRNPRRGIYIRKIEGAYAFSTKPDIQEAIRRLFAPRNRPAMSQASYETLAIVAYNQPVTRAQIEAVRGVGSDGIISRLIEKDLIHECGTLDAPGRPALFETTGTFLKEFGFASVKDLPPMDMLMYKTLQDIEGTAIQASGGKSEVQITIEQLVDSVRIPEDTVPERSNEQAGDIKDQNDNGGMSQDNVMDISTAFFGED